MDFYVLQCLEQTSLWHQSRLICRSPVLPVIMEAIKYGGVIFKACACGTLGMLMLYAAPVDAALFLDTCLENAPDDKFQTSLADTAVGLLYHKDLQVSFLRMLFEFEQCELSTTRLRTQHATASGIACVVYASICMPKLLCAHSLLCQSSCLQSLSFQRHGLAWLLQRHHVLALHASPC